MHNVFILGYKTNLNSLGVDMPLGPDLLFIIDKVMLTVVTFDLEGAKKSSYKSVANA